MAPGWIALPDNAGTSGLVPRSASVLTHASGRPWLAGHWSSDEVTVASLGAVRVAVIGSCPVSATRLAELAGRVRVPADLDAVAEALPGSFHLAGSVAGVARVQGDVTGLRGVAYAKVDGLTVAGDRADVLARLAGAELDEQVLALRVACGLLLPPPLDEVAGWRGVRTLPPDAYLRLAPDGDAREVRWWRPPEEELTLADAADRVHGALHDAVTHRALAPSRLGADLSGGMDSTSLCFLAVETAPDLLTVRWGEAESGNDDAVFAAAAANALPGVEHLVLAQDEIPVVFADPGGDGGMDSPHPFARTQARNRHTASALAARGVRRHLAGHGGDELFVRSPAYLHSLVRRRPLVARRHLRAHLAIDRWPLAGALAALAAPRDLSRWWRDQAAMVTDPTAARRTPRLGWSPLPLSAQDWVTATALDGARREMLAAASRARPLSDDSGQHQTMLSLRTTAPAYRHLVGLYSEAGVRLELPFLDRRVVEAALSGWSMERANPWRYKPLLAEAVRTTVPEVIRNRRTKGEFGADLRIGLRRHLCRILDLFADSALAARGLIDPDRLRARLLSPQADILAVAALESLLGCEAWLRAAESSTTERTGHAPAATF